MAEKLRKGWQGLPEWIFTYEKGPPLVEGHWRERIFN